MTLLEELKVLLDGYKATRRLAVKRNHVMIHTILKPVCRDLQLVITRAEQAEADDAALHVRISAAINDTDAMDRAVRGEVE